MVNIRASCATMTHIFNVAEGKKFANTWIPYGKLNEDGLQGYKIWTDGDNIYYSSWGDTANDPHIDLKLNKDTMTWETMIWNFVGDGYVKEVNGHFIWSDGTNIYNAFQAKLNKDTNTWGPVTFNNAPEFIENRIWTDGDNVYYSSGSLLDGGQFQLNKETMTWETVAWEGCSSFSAGSIWTDGEDIYLSDGGNSPSYKLIKGTKTWEQVTWTNNDSGGGISGQHMWSDGTNIYQRISTGVGVKFDKDTMSWETVTWNNMNCIYISEMWSDGTNIYYTSSGETYVLLHDSTKLYMRDGTSWKKVVSLGDG